ncbi:autotransporter outer membrane beta-barrel domain-containing protein [Pseudomonas schmalbachii]|uniref:Autotransporter outer membrane beta-barrel domain-containing protein n=1 Tax=Pseudomonas schmalbachii TaxID=2816993 RepID=A0ABS3TME6_9PSED|nr:autotransporter outer membrane beta-barrel domain-containing protein [Pseudomonas schmalbachii]MBO3274834.1 autotransporter outer membrane beta-barrel domain-containing protein [Pseudomonas schmalbachii]
MSRKIPPFTLLDRIRRNRLAQAVSVALAGLFSLRVAEAEAEDSVVGIDLEDQKVPSSAGLDIGPQPDKPARLLASGLSGQFHRPDGGVHDLSGGHFTGGPLKVGTFPTTVAIYLGNGAEATGSDVTLTAHNNEAVVVGQGSSLTLDNATFNLTRDPPFINDKGQMSYWDPDGIELGTNGYTNSGGNHPPTSGSLTLTNSTITANISRIFSSFGSDSELTLDHVVVDTEGALGSMSGTTRISDSTFVSDGGMSLDGDTQIRSSRFDIRSDGLSVRGSQALFDKVELNGAYGIFNGAEQLTVRDSAISAAEGSALGMGWTSNFRPQAHVVDSQLSSQTGNGIHLDNESVSLGDIQLERTTVQAGGAVVYADNVFYANENNSSYSVNFSDSALQSTGSRLGFKAHQMAGLDVTLIDSTLDVGDNGRIAEATEGGTLRLNTQGSDIKGSIHTQAGYTDEWGWPHPDARLDLGLQDSTWTVTDDSNLTDLRMNSGSTVQFQAGGPFKTLTVEGDLTGSGDFAMNTDLASEQGDLLKVLGSIEGNHRMFVADSGKNPAAPDGQLLMVDGNGGDGSFTLAGRSYVDAGAFRYTLEQDGDDWLLRNTALVPDEPVPPADPVAPVVSVDPASPADPLPQVRPARLDPRPETLSAGANAALGNQAATATLWNAEMNALVKRLGELRMGKDEGGVWARGIGKRYEVDNGSSRGFDQDVQGLEIGADRAILLDGSKLYVGGMIGTATSDQDFGEGASGKIDSQLVGAYATWLGDNGYYVDGVAKYNRLDNEVKTRSNTGEQVKGSYDTDGYGIDVEVGKHISLNDGWFVEPQAMLTWIHTEGASYTASNGLEVKAGDADSLQGRVGALFGKSMQIGNGMAAQPYARTSYVHEFDGDSSVTVNGYKLDNNIAGSRMEVGLGGVLQVSERTKVSLDVEHAKGNDVEEPLAVNLGVRFLW